MADYRLTNTSGVVRTSDGSFIPDDPDNRDRVAYVAWLGAGNIPDPYVAPIKSVRSVTPRQARLALLAAGLLDQVEATVKAAGGATQIAWDYATEINRTDPLIASIGSGLSLSDAQIDALFRYASAQ